MTENYNNGYPGSGLNAYSGNTTEGCIPTYTNFINATGIYPIGTSFVNGEWKVGGNATEDLTWTSAISGNVINGSIDTWEWLGSPPGKNSVLYREGK